MHLHSCRQVSAGKIECELEFAKLLFCVGEQSQSIIILRSLEDLCHENEMLSLQLCAKVSIILAEYVSLTRAEIPQRIIENFKKPIIEQARNSVGLFSKAQYKLARFAGLSQSLIP